MRRAMACIQRRISGGKYGELHHSFNGKARFNMEFPADTTSDVIQETVLADERSMKWTDGKTIVKVIVVPKKIVNIVIK